MSKRPSKDDENTWPTPSDAYKGTALPSPPGEQQGDVRESHDQEFKTEPAESPEDVLDLHDINYIDWTDIQVPHVQEPTVPVEEERDSSRVILVKEHQTEVQVPEVKGPIQEQDAQQLGVRIYHDGNKHSTCPILTCGESTKKLKHHCWQYHSAIYF
ncbi:unnamed protein product [Mytilus coruscus]|uniref:Uncharacterized protein n=1 Tax=Mytilus coruscus TaxID=42192 RepID=A0A6J8AIA9_MYTCO|nr:unnamed protein product [Mytilus coruscus]